MKFQRLLKKLAKSHHSTKLIMFQRKRWGNDYRFGQSLKGQIIFVKDAILYDLLQKDWEIISESKSMSFVEEKTKKLNLSTEEEITGIRLEHLLQPDFKKWLKKGDK